MGPTVRRFLRKQSVVLRIRGLFVANLTIAGLAGALLLFFVLYGAAWAQNDLPQRRLEIASVDLSRFPDVGVNLIVTDRQSRPLRELQSLRMRESGVPIADYETVLHSAGTDVFIVVDANSRIQEADDEGGQTRLQKVKDSILTYAGRFMDLAGRDHVTVIVPGDDGGQLLAEDVTDPAELIDAVRPYDAGRLPQSPVIEMLELALDQAAMVQDAGRFQAIVLYTDAAVLNEARFEPLIERAQALQTPFFVLLLGSGVTPNENAVQTVSALAGPTRGFFTPMPAASDSSELFQVIADNGVQTQALYRSNIRRSGTYSLTVSLENLRDETTLALTLAPPQVQLVAPARIERAGMEPDTPLESLQPSVQPVLARIEWSDGLPRALQGATLLANGRDQEAAFFGDQDGVQFDWSIAELGAGQYELEAVVTDTLGLVARSEPQTVAIAVAQPQPLPTAAPTPTAEPLQAVRELLPPLPARDDLQRLLAPAGGLLGLLLLVLIARRRGANDHSEAPPPDFDSSAGADEGDESGAHAYLASVVDSGAPAGPETLALSGNNVAIGSAAEEVQICLTDRSISSLHARIRRREGQYWLYDEGSQQGTFLNHERLGLAPKRLQNGDEIQLGRMRLVFRVADSREGKVAHVGPEGEEEESSGD